MHPFALIFKMNSQLVAILIFIKIHHFMLRFEYSFCLAWKNSSICLFTYFSSSFISISSYLVEHSPETFLNLSLICWALDELGLVWPSSLFARLGFIISNLSSSYYFSCFYSMFLIYSLFSDILFYLFKSLGCAFYM